MLTGVLKHLVPLLPLLVVLTRVLKHLVPLLPPLVVLTRVLEHLVLHVQRNDDCILPLGYRD